MGCKQLYTAAWSKQGVAEPIDRECVGAPKFVLAVVCILEALLRAWRDRGAASFRSLSSLTIITKQPRRCLVL